MLLMLRSGGVMEPYTWGLPGGRCEDEDTDERDCAIREFLEETSCPETVTGPSEPIYVFREPGFAYHNFIGYVEHEFKPVLDWENDDFGWFAPGVLPSPLHFGTRQLFEKVGDKILRMFPKRRASKRRSSRRLTANKRANPLDNVAFRRWFGDSKVVDKLGRPLVMYHGSPQANFVTFDPKRSAGVFFTDSLITAETYGQAEDVPLLHKIPTEPAPGIYAAYLRIENPLIVKARGREHHEIRTSALQMTPEALKKVWWNDWLPPELSTDQIALIAERAGYDGVIIRGARDESGGDWGNPDAKPSTICTVFSPTQIKSANMNVGTYDPADPSILKNGRRR